MSLYSRHSCYGIYIWLHLVVFITARRTICKRVRHSGFFSCLQYITFEQLADHSKVSGLSAVSYAKWLDRSTYRLE